MIVTIPKGIITREILCLRCDEIKPHLITYKKYWKQAATGLHWVNFTALCDKNHLDNHCVTLTSWEGLMSMT